MTRHYLFGGLDHRQTDDCARRRLRDRRPADAHRQRRVALAAGRQSRHPADFRFRRPKPARLRPASARSRRSTHFRTTTQHWELRPSLWIEPIGDWGEGQVQLLEIPAAPRTTPTSSPMAAQGRHRRRARRSPSPIASSGAGRRRRGPRSPPARRARAWEGRASRQRFTRRIVRRPVRRPAEAAAATPTFSRRARARSSRARLYVRTNGQTLVRVVFDLDPGSEAYSELAPVLECGRSAGQRNMALPMDSVTAAPRVPAAPATPRRRRRWRCRCNR